MFRKVIGLVVVLGACHSTAPAFAAQAVLDTAVARSVYWGEPLANLLQGVGKLVQAGFGDREAGRISDAALTLSPYPLSGAAPRRSATFVYRVRFRDRLTRLTIRLTPVEIGHVDVRFQAADTGLIAVLRDVIWKAHLASLLPLEGVRLDLRDRLWVHLGPPKLVLGVWTETVYGCLGYAIEHRFSQRGDTMDLELFGVSPPMGPCPAMLGPARLARELDVLPGHYTLLVRYRETSGRFTVDVTDSSTKVTTDLADFVHADERLRWRFPPRSLELTCGNAGPVCDDVGRWLAHQPGISPLSFSPEGLNPYQPDAAIDPNSERMHFRYANDEALAPVKRCFAEIERRIREAVGLFLTLQTWKGERITAWSRRSFHEPHIGEPERVTTGPQCSTGS